MLYVLFMWFVHLYIVLPYLSLILFLLLESARAEEHGVPQPATGTQPVAKLACVTASLRVPVLLAAAGKSGTNSRPGWSTVTLRDYSYHSSTLALSRAKVTPVSVPHGKSIECKD